MHRRKRTSPDPGEVGNTYPFERKAGSSGCQSGSRGLEREPESWNVEPRRYALRAAVPDDESATTGRAIDTVDQDE